MRKKSRKIIALEPNPTHTVRQIPFESYSPRACRLFAEVVFMRQIVVFRVFHLKFQQYRENSASQIHAVPIKYPTN